MTSRYQIIISENIFYVMQKGREERTMGCDGLMQKVSCHIGASWQWRAGVVRYECESAFCEGWNCFSSKNRNEPNVTECGKSIRVWGTMRWNHGFNFEGLWFLFWGILLLNSEWKSRTLCIQRSQISCPFNTALLSKKFSINLFLDHRRSHFWSLTSKSQSIEEAPPAIGC